jgi:asparagine synthase (glutamine-hydrolysing)
VDHEVMELAAQMPAGFKLKGNRSKHILLESCADLLPPENVDRPKMGFAVPVADWFRGSLRELMRDALLSDESQRGYLEPAAVRKLVDDHLAQRANHSARLWSLLMLELWHRDVLSATSAP